MGFRRELDLTDIVADYELFGGRSDRRRVDAREFLPPSEPSTPPPDDPARYGPLDRLWASSCTVLQPFRPVIWDVNGYYAALGVSPYATRRELRQAYEALGGPDDRYLTYVFHQLLNRATRRKYDAMTLGEVFLDDIVAEEMRRRAAAESGRRSDKGEEVSADDILDEWGYTILNDEESAELDRLDSSPAPGKDRPYQESWGYSYYLWRTWERDAALLKLWQALLVRKLSEAGHSIRFAVGSAAALQGGYELVQEDEDFIFFVEQGTIPTPDLAQQAVLSYRLRRLDPNRLPIDPF
jgi:hypothetical protein